MDFKFCKNHCTSCALCTTSAKMLGDTAVRRYQLSSSFGCKKSVQSPTSSEIRKVYSGLSTVFLLLLLLAVGVGFLAACFGR